jgi:transaldolase
MAIFLDSVNLREINSAKEKGILDGVTTNSSLMRVSAGSIGRGEGHCS